MILTLDHESTEPYFADIPITSLDEWDANPRGDVGDVAGLMESLKTMGGSMTPLIVWPASDARYVVIDGNRRLAALRAVFQTHDLALHPDHMIHCLVVPKAATDEALRLRIAAASDGTKLGWSPSNTLDAYSEMAAQGVSVAGIAAASGATSQEVAQALLVAATIDHVGLLTAVDNGEMPFSHAVLLAAYVARMPEERRAGAVEDCWTAWQYHGPFSLPEWSALVRGTTGVDVPASDPALPPAPPRHRARKTYRLPSAQHGHAARLYEALNGGMVQLADTDRELVCQLLAPYAQ